MGQHIEHQSYGCSRAPGLGCSGGSAGLVDPQEIT
jgi:hypothetical protein